MRKLLAFILTLVTTSLLCVSAVAVDGENMENSLVPPVDYGNPIQETTYFDEDLNATVTERMYFVPDSISAYGSDVGSGWCKKEKTFTWGDRKTTTTYYAEGYFRWGDGDVSVSQPRGGYDYIPSNWYVESQDTEDGTGHYAQIFNKYAYVKYDLVIIENDSIFPGNNAKSFSVTCRISESGNPI